MEYFHTEIFSLLLLFHFRPDFVEDLSASGNKRVYKSIILLNRFPYIHKRNTFFRYNKQFGRRHSSTTP